MGSGLEVIWWEASDMAYASRTGTWERQIVVGEEGG